MKCHALSFRVAINFDARHDSKEYHIGSLLRLVPGNMLDFVRLLLQRCAFRTIASLASFRMELCSLVLFGNDLLAALFIVLCNQ